MTVYDVAAKLPSISVLRDRSKALAVLAAVCEPDADDRPTFAYDAERGLACWDNGCGDEYSVVYSEAGAILRGFDHTAVMSPYAKDEV